MKSKEQKRDEAKERQEYREGLTLDQKLAIIKSRRGSSKREFDKLMVKKMVKKESK